MSGDIEAAMDALLAYIEANVVGFVTISRRTRHWSQVSDQPALFLRRIGMMDAYDGAHLAIRTIDCEIWIYCNAGDDPDAVPDDALMALEQAVRDCMAPKTLSDPRFTINDQVYWCRIEGKSDIAPGDQGGQAIARMPVKITLP